MIINWFNIEIYFLTGESVKTQITDSISKNFTDSDLESMIRKCAGLIPDIIEYN